MKTRLLFVLIIAFLSKLAVSSTGWYWDYVLISKNGETPAYYWIGEDPGAHTQLSGYDFGTVSTLQITGADMRYWSDTQDRTGSAFYFLIRGLDNVIYVGPTEIIMDQEYLSGNDYRGTIFSFQINLLENLKPNTEYKLEIYAKHWGTNQGDNWLSNNGLNYVANFKTSPVMVFGANEIIDGTGYSGLKLAVNSINNTNSQLNKEIEIRIGSSLTETSQSQLYFKNWKNLTIFPTEDSIVIEGEIANSLIRLNNVKYVVIDGRKNKTGSDISLTIINSSNSTNASVIDFINGSKYNIVKYCKIKGQTQATTNGLIFFGGSTSVEGNSYNKVLNNEISGISDNERPRNAISSNGSNGKENIYNEIKNNKIFNFINKEASSNGINLNYNSNYFTIENNSIYEEVENLEIQGRYLYYAIISNNNSVVYIKNNYIGGNAPEAQGVWKFVGKETDGKISAPFSFTAIRVSGKNDESSIVENNTIKGFHMITGGLDNNHDTWDGIYINSGNVIVRNNTIGAPEGNASIYVEATNGGTIATSHGILNNSQGKIYINSNIIGSIEIKGAIDYSHSFESIYLRASNSTAYITDNLIGSTTTTKSINVSGTAINSNYKQDVYGIYSASQGTTYIYRNTIANLHNSYTGTNSLARTRAIRIINGSNYVQDNIIFNISSNSNQAADNNNSGAVIGIDLSSNQSGFINNIIGNRIYNLNADNNNSNAVSCFGIYFNGANNNERNIIAENFVYNVNSTSTNINTLIIGIHIMRGNNIVYNNIISLGTEIPYGYRIYGIWDDGLSNNNNNIYFNTVLIMGNVTIGSTTSVGTAIWNSNNSSVRDYRNNIFASQRKVNNSGNNNLYAIRLGGITNVTIDNNNYWSDGNRIGRIGSGPLRVSLAQWRIATGQDQNSLEINPDFQNSSGNWNDPHDFLTGIYISLPGISLSPTVTTDYDQLTRLNPPKMGAFENNNYVWYGTVSTDFNNPQNWAASGSGIVPPNGADVIFAANPQNDCYLDQNRTIRNIIINNSTGSNKFVLNGNKLTLTGSLNFSNGAQLDARTNGSILELAGTLSQILPLGSITDNEFAGIELNNEFGFNQNEDFLVKETLILTKGAYNIGSNTLFINGDVSLTNGNLNGGDSSIIVFGGNGNATILPSVTLKDLTINRVSGINLSGDVEVKETLSLSSGTLNLDGNKLILSGNSPTGTGNINGSAANSELVCNNINPIILSSTFFGNNPIDKLTIEGTGGVTSEGNFKILSLLELKAENPSSTKGLLDMNDGSELKVLTMGANATTIGQGDVSGKVRRTEIEANIVYSFGSEFSTISFTGGTGSQLPDSITFIIRIGTLPPNGIKNDAVKRYYEIIRAGGSSPTRFNLTLRYLPSELNGNNVSKMVFWDHHVPYNGLSPHEHGVSFHNVENSYMTLASHGIGYLVTGEYTGEIPYIDNETTPPNQSKIWILANRNTPTGSDVFIWIGPYDENTDWTNDNNWADNCSPANAASGSCPNPPYNGAIISPETHKIFIQKAASPCLAPDSDLKAYSIYVEENGEFIARNNKNIEVNYIKIFETGKFIAANDTITVNGAINLNNGNVSWNNAGTFTSNTSTVVFTNSNAAISGITDFYSIEIKDGAKISLMDNSKIGIKNEINLNSTGILNTTFYGNSTVEYNGTNQNIINPENDEYYNLFLSGNGTKTFPTGLTKILGNLEIIDTSTTTAANSLIIEGNLKIDNQASFSTGNYDHTLKRSFENNGTFLCLPNTTFKFNGNIQQIISGDTISTFEKLKILNPASVLIMTDVNINDTLKLYSGNLKILNCTLGINNHIIRADENQKIELSKLTSLNFGGTDTIYISNNLFLTDPEINNLKIDRPAVVIGNQNFTINGELNLNSGKLIVGSSTLGINGSIISNGKIDLINNSSLRFGGNDTIIIPDDVFTGTTEITNLIIERNGTVVLNNQIFTIKGLLNLVNGTLNFEDKELNISGDIIGSLGKFSPNENSILYIWENSTDDAAIFLPNGCFSQNHLGTLRINRTNGFNLSNQDIIISDKLILEKGIINNNDNLIIFNKNSYFSTSASGVSDPDENRYINGCVRKIGKTAFLFPIGKDNVFAPAAISEAASGSEDDWFEACYYNYSPDLDGFYTASKDAGIDHVSTSEYWTLDRNGSNSVNVTLTWNSRSGGIDDLDNLTIVHWDGNKWEDKGGSATGNSETGSITSEVVSQFSPFTLASKNNNNPLPVNLIFFKGECLDNEILFTWQTNSEINNDYFVVEASQDHKKWIEISKIKGSGNSSSIKRYSIKVTDKNYNYFRLKQIDYDGKQKVCQIINLDCNLLSGEIQIYPNPNNGHFKIFLPEFITDGTIIISDLTGREVHKKEITNREIIEMNLNLNPGVYNLNIISGYKFFNNKTIITK